MFKTLLLFCFYQMANVAAYDGGLERMTPYRNLEVVSEGCIAGTIALNTDADVIEALSPFYVSLENLINHFDDNPNACTVEIIFLQPLVISCNFDFSNLTGERETAQEACEGAGGKIFIYDMEFSVDLFISTFSLEVIQFPVCIDENCSIDEVAVLEEALRSEEDPDIRDPIVKVTPSCIEDPNTKFFLKKKRKKNNEFRAIKKTCGWLDGIQKEKRKMKICTRTEPFRRFRPAREMCPQSCCAYERK